MALLRLAATVNHNFRTHGLNMTRAIPEDRIKTLHARTIIPGELKFDIADQIAKRNLAEQIAYEIVNKLFEFHKVDFQINVDGAREYISSIDVIVPTKKSPCSKRSRS